MECSKNLLENKLLTIFHYISPSSWRDSMQLNILNTSKQLFCCICVLFQVLVIFLQGVAKVMSAMYSHVYTVYTFNVPALL